LMSNRSCVDIGDGSSVEIVDYFCYLGDMLSVDGDADAAVTARIRSGWFKFKFAGLFLAAKRFQVVVLHPPRLLRGKVYDACVRICVLHGSDTWLLKRENELALHRTEIRMIRWMCDVKLMDKHNLALN